MDKFEIPLDIPEVEIENVELNQKGDIIISVKSKVKGTKCRKCGRTITNHHGYDKQINLRHLSILGRKTYIRIRPSRYQCPYCDNNPTTTQRLPWYDQRSPHTREYEKHILLLVVNSTVEDVSIKEDLGYEAVMGIINRHINYKQDWVEINKLDVIGIDEISLKKGHNPSSPNISSGGQFWAKIGEVQDVTY